MNNKMEMLNSLHKLFRKDPYINSILEAAGVDLDKISTEVDGIKAEMFFDTMTEKGILIYQKELAYPPKSTFLEGKRLEIEARWKTTGKCDLKLLQKIADTWRNGEIEVQFKNAVIKIKFISLIGIPDDLEALKHSINEAKPAHLPIEYLILYRTWGMLSNRTWDSLKTNTWIEWKDKEGI